MKAIKTESATLATKYLEEVRLNLRTFRQEFEAKMQTLRESSINLLRAMKFFSEGGNFSIEEVNLYRGKLDKATQKINQSEGEILGALETAERRRQDAVTNQLKLFEDKLKPNLSDVIYAEAISRCLNNARAQVKVQYEDSKSQSKKIGNHLEIFQNKLKELAHGTAKLGSLTEKEHESAIQSINQSNIETLLAFDLICTSTIDRCTFLNCLKTQTAPKVPDEEKNALKKNQKTNQLELDKKVVFQQGRDMISLPVISQVSKAGKPATEDTGIKLVKELLRTTNQVLNDSAENKINVAQDTDKAEVTEKSGQPQTAQISRSGSQLSSAKTNHTTAKSLIGGVSSKTVAKNQRFDKKYQVFGEPTLFTDPTAEQDSVMKRDELLKIDSVERVTFLGRVRRICREALEAILLASENYFRAKGNRASTRPSLIPETFDSAADTAIEALRALEKEAANFNNNAVREFHVQLHEIEDGVCLMPSSMFTGLVRRLQEIIQEKFYALSQEFQGQFQSIETSRLRHSLALKPQLISSAKLVDSNRIVNLELNQLCSNESERVNEELNLAKEIFNSRKTFLSLIGRTFAYHLESLTEGILIRMDSLIYAVDVEQPKEEEIPKRVIDLLVKQRKPILPEAEDTPVTNEGKTSWPLVDLEFFTRGFADEAKPKPEVDKKGDKKILTTEFDKSAQSYVGYLVSAKCTKAHEAVIQARDEVLQVTLIIIVDRFSIQDFQRHLSDRLVEVETLYRNLLADITHWQNSWNSQTALLHDAALS
ncbi:hypothetical protein Ciccas_000924 [Cichlidogyrus casuarinus]|uniref:DUF4456 domain-containing protein n=1 Tax=Cichlidogyrus casuarinus TaxID=1844966 RepID=A0ABD2QLH6_9PLAT